MRRGLLAGLGLVAAVSAGLFAWSGAQSGDARCAVVRFDSASYGGLPAATTLDDQLLSLLSEELSDPTAGGPFQPDDRWRVVRQTSDAMEVLQQLSAAEREQLGGATHRVAVLMRSDGITGVADGTWLPDVIGTCEARRADGYDTQAELALSETPSRDDTVLELLVRERTCTSGRDAEGRINVDEMTTTNVEVRLRVSVDPSEGEQDCQRSPSTPFRLDLDEPIDDRAVVDANLVPPRALKLDDVRGSDRSRP